MDKSNFAQRISGYSNLINKELAVAKPLSDLSYHWLLNEELSKEEFLQALENYIMTNCTLQAITGKYELVLGSDSSIFSKMNRYCDNINTKDYIQSVLKTICEKHGLIYKGVQSFHGPSICSPDYEVHVICFCEEADRVYSSIIS